MLKQKKELQEIIKKNSYRENFENQFNLASGKKSPYYFDLKQTLLYPMALEMAAELFLESFIAETNQYPDFIAGLTMGADPLLYTISLLARQKEICIKPIVIRKENKDHGSKQRAEGLVSEIYKDSSVFLIDDVITTGGSTLQAYEVMKGLLSSAETTKPKDMFLNNVKVLETPGIEYVFSVVDRQEGGSENFKKNGLKLFSLYKTEDFSSK